MGVIAGKEPPCRDVGKPTKRMRRVITPEGAVRYERVPVVPSMRVVDLEGNVVDVPLTNGGNNHDPRDPYRMYITQRKRARGMIPVNRCPVAQGHDVRQWLPDAMRSRPPCHVATSGRPLDPEREIFPRGHHCQCIDDLIAARRAEHRRVESKRKTAQESVRELQARMAEQQLAATVDVNAKLVDLLERQLGVNDNAKPEPKASNENRPQPTKPGGGSR